MLRYKHFILTGVCFFLLSAGIARQTEKKPLIIDLSYNVKNNQFPYLLVFTKTKEGKTFPAVPGREVSVYINEAVEEMRLGKIKTDNHGKGYITIDAKFKPLWDSASNFSFFATCESDKIYEESNTEITITKAKILLDTVADAETRSLAATILEQQGNTYVPVKEVELKIIIKRMAGSLSAGDEDSYTTDSLGLAVAEFKKDSIPGDQQGYIVIVAKTEDNDTYGNISIEKKINWGSPKVAVSGFDRRTLFATRDKSPWWLLVLAYSIAIGVWGTIIYLAGKIIRIRNIGRASSQQPIA